MGMVRYVSWGIAFALVALLAYGSEWFGLPGWVFPVGGLVAGIALHIGYRWGRGYWMGDEPISAGSRHLQPRQ